MTHDPKIAARKRWFGACKEAGLDEEARRAVQARICGKDSASTMSVRDFNACLADLQTRGLWKPKPKKPGGGDRKPSDNPQSRMIWAIWGDMCRAGIPKDPTRPALRAFLEHDYGVSDPDYLTVEQARKCIEALKAWRKRVEGQHVATSSQTGPN